MSEMCSCGLRAGDVGQQVKPAQRLDGLGDELGAERLVAEIAGHGDRLATRRLHERDHFLRVGLLFGQVVQHEVRTLAGEGDRRCAPDARVRARDETLAAGEASESLIGLFAVVWLWIHLLSSPGAGCGCLSNSGWGYCVRGSCMAY